MKKACKKCEQRIDCIVATDVQVLTVLVDVFHDLDQIDHADFRFRSCVGEVDKVLDGMWRTLISYFTKVNEKYERRTDL